MTKNVLVVKTHEPATHSMRMFNKAIILVRDPFESVKSEFNRRLSDIPNIHIGHAPEFLYRQHNGKVWKDFVFKSSTSVHDWEAIYTNWYYHFIDPKTRHVIFYNDLVHSTEHELRKALDFLKRNVTNKDIKCALTHKEGLYHRKNKTIGVEIFDAKMRDKINWIKNRVYKMLKGEMPMVDWAENMKAWAKNLALLKLR